MKEFNPKVAETARKIIADFIKERRKEVGYTQGQLAEMAGIRKATLVDVEAGRAYNFNTLLAILGCLRGEIQIIWKDIDGGVKYGSGTSGLPLSSKELSLHLNNFHH